MKASPFHWTPGTPEDRLDGLEKVTGTATYAYEYAVDNVTYGFPVQSTIAKGRITAIDSRAAREIPGVLAVISHENAPRLSLSVATEIRELIASVIPSPRHSDSHLNRYASLLHMWEVDLARRLLLIRIISSR
jgi:CO/xanthine dehydrogenase Mo-binding subunit